MGLGRVVHAQIRVSRRGETHLTMALSPDLLSASSNLLCPEDAGDVASWDPSAATTADDEWAPPCPAAAAAAAGLLDGRSLAALLAVEAGHAPPGAAHFVSRPLLAAARNDAVKWILKASDPLLLFDHLHLLKNVA